MRTTLTVILFSLLLGCGNPQAETESKPSVDTPTTPSAAATSLSEGSISELGKIPHSVEEQLVGTWIAVRGEAQGEPTFLEGFSFTFDGANFKAGAPHSTHSTAQGEYTLDTAKTPMHITFTGFGLGIFQFKDGQLFLCIDRDVRPTKFATSPSSYEILSVCERKE